MLAIKMAAAKLIGLALLGTNLFYELIRYRIFSQRYSIDQVALQLLVFLLDLEDHVLGK